MIAAKIQQQCNQEIEGAVVSVFRAPPIQGLGNAGGFKLQTEQRGYVDLGELQTMTDQLVQRARTDPHYAAVFTLYRAHTPQLFVDIDRAKVQSLQVPIQDVFTTLQVYMGGYYVNQFNKFGRTWQVNIQADPESRTSADILKQLYVRSSPRSGPGPDGAAGHAASAPRTAPARCRSCATTCTRRPRSTASRRPASAPAPSSRR